VLKLSNNAFTGSIPTSMGELTSLIDLRLDHNFLRGTIPDSFGNLAALTNMELQDNELSGTIPYACSNMLSLRKFLFVSFVYSLYFTFMMRISYQ
jgi:Leucine-rich repeat (LRR) protein